MAPVIEDGPKQNTTTAQEQAVDSLEDIRGTNWVGCASDEYIDNFQEQWPQAEQSLRELGLQSPELLKELCFMREVTKEIGNETHALNAIEDQIKSEYNDMRAAGKFEGKGDGDPYVELMMDAMSTLERHGLIDQELVMDFTMELVQAKADVDDASVTERVNSRNLDFRDSVDEVVGPLVAKNIRSGNVAELTEAFATVREAILSASSGEDAVMALVELTEQGGLAGEVADAFAPAGMYFLNCDSHPEGKAEIKGFVESILVL